MAKIGIMSMQRIVNYGSFLQAYGLKAMLEEFGKEPVFVDYHIGSSLVTDGNKQKTGIRRKINKACEVLNYDASLKNKISFILYKKQFAKKYDSVLGITRKLNYRPELDLLIIGSDEVFNCIQENSNVGYSLELFGKDNKAEKLISYAASFGNTTLEKLEKYGKTDEIGALLKKFDVISVRDKNSGRIVRQLSGKEPEYHLDPVLVYDFIGKCKLIPQIEVKEKYLILYAYTERVDSKEALWIYKYAKRKGLKIYSIGGIHKCADRFINCSPFELLAYFQKAEEVITDTFHGTIFSIISKRPFVTIVRKSSKNIYGNEEKLADLLERLSLKDRMIEKIQSAEDVLDTEIKYTEIDKIIKDERLRSRGYLSGFMKGME